MDQQTYIVMNILKQWRVPVLSLIAMVLAGTLSAASITWPTGCFITGVNGSGFLDLSGVIDDLAPGSYFITLNRSGDFQTINFQMAVNGINIIPNNVFTYPGGDGTFTTSGIIPAGLSCFQKEQIVITFHNVFGGTVTSCPYEIRNFGSPEFSINGISSNDKKALTMLSGCGNMVLTSNDACQPQSLVLSIVEVDGFNNFANVPGTEVFRSLSPGEVSALYGSGLSITTFTSGSGSITISDNKWYGVTLTNTVNGMWVPTYRYVHVKPGTWDLFMQDNANDDGFEPVDRFDNDVFQSPDLWNKLSNTSDPNSIKNEPPDHVTIPGNTNKLLVKVHNGGCQASMANANLFLYWTRARMGELWSKHWIFSMSSNSVPSAVPPHNLVAGGSEITISGATMSNPYNTVSMPFQLPSIAAGGSYQMPFSSGVNWFPPDPLDFDVNNGQMGSATKNPVICLLARLNGYPPISSAPDKMIWQPTGMTDAIEPYVKNNNNVATRNTDLVDLPQFLVVRNNHEWDYGFGTVLVNNDNGTTQTGNICIDLLPGDGLVNFLDHGSIEIGTTTGLWSGWLTGGSQAENVQVITPTLVSVTDGTHACLNNIQIGVGSLEQVGVRFVYNDNNLPAATLNYAYQLSMTDAEGARGSSVVYQGSIPTTAPDEVSGGGGTEIAGKQTELGVTAEEAASQLHVYPNPANDQLFLSGYRSVTEKTTITVTDISGKLVERRTIGAGEGYYTENLNTGNWPAGLYLVHFASGERISTQKVSVAH